MFIENMLNAVNLAQTWHAWGYSRNNMLIIYVKLESSVTPRSLAALTGSSSFPNRNSLKSLTLAVICRLPNIKRYCGLFWIHCSSKKFKRITWEAMDLCLRVLKESSKSRFDSYSVINSVLIISHITFRDCRVHIFSDILSRNSCMLLHHWTSLQPTATVMLFTERRKASELGFYNDCTTFRLSFSSE